MFGLGFVEILIILLALLVFVNPKDLPKVFRRLGRFVRQLRDFRDSAERYLRDIEREVGEENREQRPARPQAGEENEHGGEESDSS